MLTLSGGFLIPTKKPLGGEKVSEKAIAAKQEVVNEIKEKIENSKSVTLVGFDRMDVQEITDLRTKFREGNSEYKVYKNTMMRFAFEELGYSDLTGELKGANALIFSNEDSVSGPKVAVDYRKESDEAKEKLLIKAGLVDGLIQTSEQMTSIASLPSKDVLYSMLANVLLSPISTLAGDLNNTVAKIALALDAVRVKREENGEVAEEVSEPTTEVEETEATAEAVEAENTEENAESDAE
nr:50S ribosomal protein L10 [Anaerococcus sp. mt242]